MPDQISVDELRANLSREWPAMAARISWAVPYLYRMRDRLYDDLCRRVAPFDLLPADLDVLMALRVQAPSRELTPTVLYRSLFLSSGGVTKILNRLDERGLIERPYNPLDGRSRLVRLTPQGLDRLEQAMESVIDHQRLFMSPLQAEEQGKLTRLLEKLVAAAEQPGQL